MGQHTNGPQEGTARAHTSEVNDLDLRVILQNTAFTLDMERRDQLRLVSPLILLSAGAAATRSQDAAFLVSLAP